MTASIALRLADGICIARFGSCVIVLDVHHDWYRQFGDEAAKLLCAIEDGTSIDPNQPLVERLQANGLIARDGRRSPHWRPPGELPVPEESALEGGDPPHDPGLHDIAIVLECMASHWALRRRSLARVLHDLPAPRPRHTIGDITVIARTFDRGRRLAPFSPRCLPDALAFVRYARRRGHRVDLVFGVKLHPFEAHCWAQSGNLVLTDPLDRVLRFQPILVV